MNYFLYKLNAPRRTFPADMTPAERQLMQEHAVYWRGLMKKNLVIAFGPVADPKGAYGIAIIRLQDATDANSLGANDPVIKADTGFSFEVHPMPSVVLPEEHG
ncbi:MAG: hypothetical protein KGJ56_04990 [Gammaproteobacteria bacterium]|nr:hypothetical protein [Gammaproteobacteria bacterium]